MYHSTMFPVFQMQSRFKMQPRSVVYSQFRTVSCPFNGRLLPALVTKARLAIPCRHISHHLLHSTLHRPSYWTLIMHTRRDGWYAVLAAQRCKCTRGYFAVCTSCIIQGATVPVAAHERPVCLFSAPPPTHLARRRWWLHRACLSWWARDGKG